MAFTIIFIIKIKVVLISVGVLNLPFRPGVEW